MAQRDRPFQRHKFEEHGRSLCGAGSAGDTSQTSRHFTNISWHIMSRSSVHTALSSFPPPGDSIDTLRLNTRLTRAEGSRRRKRRNLVLFAETWYNPVISQITSSVTLLPVPVLIVERCTNLFRITSKMKMNLKIHIKKMHSTITDLQCDMCEFKTKHSFNFLRHKRRMHDHKSLKENCPKCKKPCFNVEWHLSVYHSDKWQFYV